MSVERLIFENKLLALVVRANYRAEGIDFFTDQDSSQQLGYMNRETGYVVQPHFHKPLRKEVHMTQEVLLLRSGSCRLDLYGDENKVKISTVLKQGDVVLLAAGGHGLVMLEQTEIIEIKQGPYSGDDDKVRFNPSEEAE